MQKDRAQMKHMVHGNRNLRSGLEIARLAIAGSTIQFSMQRDAVLVTPLLD